MFKFALGQTVSLMLSGETGIVIGRAEYAHSETGYLIRYKNAYGALVTDWWGESALVAG